MLLLLNIKMELRMKTFNIWAFFEKSDFQIWLLLVFFFTKSNKEERLRKKGGLDSLQISRRLVKKEGVTVFEGRELIPKRILSFLTKGERKAFLGESKKGTHVVRLPPRAQVVIREERISPFVKLEVTLHLLYFLFLFIFLVTLFRVGFFISSLTYGS